jgi:ribonuclease D
MLNSAAFNLILKRKKFLGMEISTTSTKIKIFNDDLDKELLEHFLKQEFVTVDTETRGLIIPRDRLCVVQIAAPDGTTALVRFTKDSKIPTIVQSNLKAMLEAPNLLKVFHFARFDVSVLKYYLSANTHPIWCTKIASKLVRTYADRHSLRDLALELLGVEMDKSNQMSDWAREDLSQSQLEYAANDVKLLVPIYKKLRTLVERENLSDLADRISAFVSTISELDLKGWKNIFEH